MGRKSCQLFCKNGHRQIQGSKYSSGVCKHCHSEHMNVNYYKDPEKTRARQRASRLKNIEQIRAHDRSRSWKKHLSRRYLMTEQEYDLMVRKQQGLCGICGKPVKKLRVDHNHKTGKVRGLLCDRCNVRLESIESHIWRQNAEDYLMRHPQ